MVITKKDNNQELEPIEEVVIDVPIDYVGQVQTELGQRRAELQKQFHSSSKNLTNLVYLLPTRNLLGIRSNLMTLTKGTALINSRIVGFKPLGQALSQLRNGVIIAYETGETTAYSLQNAEARGLLFVNPAEKVYKGQIVGITNRREDIEVNVCKGKHLTNMRSSSSDGVVQLSPPKKMSLEECLDFIENDELLEVTPESLRLRKSELDSTLRKRQNK
jgi:GTP-binding protein